MKRVRAVRRMPALALLLVVGAAAAPLLEADLESTGGVSYQGGGLQGWTSSGAILDQRDGLGFGTMEAEGTLTWSIIEFDVAWGATEPGSPVGPRLTYQRTDPEMVDSGSAVALRAQPAGFGYSLRAIGDIQHELAGSFDVLPPRNPYMALRGSIDPYLDLATQHHFPRAGGPAILGNSSSSCTCRLIFFAADITLDGQSIATGAIEQARSPDPASMGHVRVDRHRILEVALDGQVSTRGPGWIHYVSALHAALDGDLQLHDARGSGTLNGTAIPDRQHLFQAMGNMSVTATWDERQSRWQLSGDPDFVAINAATFFGQRPGAAVPVAAIVAASAIVVALAVLTKFGRFAIEALWGLVTRTDAAHTKVGQTIMAHLEEHPVATHADLCDLGLTKYAVRHHVGRLLRQEHLQATTIDNKQYVMLNSSSLRQRRLGLASQDKIQTDRAMAAIAHPVRRAIFAAVQGAGQADYQAIKERLGDACPPQPTTSKHLHRMVAEGALVRHQDGKRAYFVANIDPATIQAHQHRILARHS